MSAVNCVFCKIVNKEIPTTVIFQNDRIIAFPDIKPAAPIHYLIIPKEHIESIAQLETNHREVLADLIYTAKKIARDKALAGYKLTFNVGRAGGQMIDHLHLHLLGGWTKTPAEI